MKIIMFWSTIINEAKKCGTLRKQGKNKEADSLQKQLEKRVRLGDEVVLDC